MKFTSFHKLVIILCMFVLGVNAQPKPAHDLAFKSLPKQWDEAIPLGNGWLGALVWQKEERLRISLDRADLWDMRPMKGLHRKEFSFQWVVQQVKKRDYQPVQQYFDVPYDTEPGPTKIPGAALEFNSKGWGTVLESRLSLGNARCEVRWSGGTRMTTFVSASKPYGWFRFENIPADFEPQLIAPRYEGAIISSGNPVGGDDLARLGYKQGIVKRQGNSMTYRQEGWGGFSYTVSISWKRIGASVVEGVWSISAQHKDSPVSPTARSITANALKLSFAANLKSHAGWWKNFWEKSSIQLPDKVLEKQWYLEQYKFGSVARSDAPPISLQAIWTADNGRIPPWKGDFHHDLNTQLSYWPACSANHLQEAMGYINHLEKNKENYLRYTQTYFGFDGLAVPGVTTLDGTEMGGWIQYSLSPTVSSWLAQHYYLQWRYSMDRDFLKNKAYPWIKQTAVLLENLTHKDASGFRKLEISASPEINDNSLEAWFPENTNYDLALMKFTFSKAAELSTELGLTKESSHWQQILNEFGDYALTDKNQLKFAPSMDYNQSHRHFSNMMAIHPLGLIKWEDGDRAQSIIRNSIKMLDSVGPDYWCGYSYSWLGNLKARAKDGAGAAKALKIFAEAFCSSNSFHLNGDQTKSGLSQFIYRPFTLEGNFAFAAGIQEMLLQSHAGFIEVMPAVPQEWKNIAFNDLRAEGAFLISACKEAGELKSVKLIAEKGGSTILKLPFKDYEISGNNGFVVRPGAPGFLELSAKAGAILLLTNNKT